MQKADIVLVSFPFSDLSGTKKRPALVLHVNKTEVAIMFITTNLLSADLHDINLQPSPTTGLKKPSILKITKLVTLHQRLILGRLSRLELACISKSD